jgi:GPH family glycoside/pentoside/hexuronide:cation symporter
MPPSCPSSASARVPIKTQLAWGASGIADTFLTYGVASLVLPIFNLGYGLNAILLGYALAIPRLVDAFTDPIMGSISDNTRSRWGRRRPYILAGTIIAAALFPFIWLPPATGDVALFAWLCGGLVLLTLASTVFAVPAIAMGYELTTDYDERTRVMAARLYLSIVAGLSIQWLYKLLVLPAFGGSETEGIRYIGPIVAVLILVTGLPAALFCRERAALSVQPKIKLKEALLMTGRNRSFLVLMGGYILLVLALNMVGSLGLYVNIFHVCGGDKSFAGEVGGVFGSVMVGAAALSMWVLTKVSARTSKRTAVFIALMFGILGNASLWLTMDPAHPWLQVASAALIGFGVQGCWLMVDSMIGDVCDEDEISTGLRREGMYAAIKGFSCKVALSAASILSGYFLVFSGYQEGLAPSIEVTTRMKLMLVTVQCAGLVIAGICFALYPLTRARAEANRRTLDGRRQSAVPASVA